MIPQKSGAIVQINSKSGKKGSFRNSAYAASKFAGIGLTQSIALDLAPTKSASTPSAPATCSMVLCGRPRSLINTPKRRA